MSSPNRRDRIGSAAGLFGWVTLAYLAGAVLAWQSFGAGWARRSSRPPV